MKKNSFTLIELLAVIIILAMVALIATPIILNVIEDAKNEADMRTVDGLVDGGRQYCANAMFDTTAKDNIDNGRNVYDDIVVSGSKPAKGDIYVNDKCQVAIKVVQNKKCYTKFFDGQITVKEESLCNDFVGKDDIIPTVELELVSGTINDLGWSKEDLKIKVTIKDNESGPSHYKWCSDVSDCTPTSTVNSDTGLVDIKAEGNNKVCVVGFDKSGKESELKCSDIYKIDKTKPVITGISDVKLNINDSIDLSKDITTSDILSGIKGNFTFEPNSVDTSVVGTTKVIYKVSDKAGNETVVEKNVEVVGNAPSITFSTTTLPNSNNWFNTDFFVKGIITDNSNKGIKSIKWCSDIAECTPITTVTDEVNVKISTESSTNKVCIEATDNNDKVTTLCSGDYKLDKTKPTIEGIADITIQKNGTVNLTNNVTVNDSLSGINGSHDYNPKIVDTTKAGTTNITYTVSDKAGNNTEVTRKVIVDSEAPTIIYKPLGDKINGSGWAKENFFVKIDLVDNSGLGIKEGKWCSSNTSSTCTPNALISGTTMSPQISLEGSNRICVIATDNNNKTSEVSCSDVYKLDKTAPNAGTATISGTLGSNSWYTSNVTITPVNGSDGLSGHSTTTTNVSSITSNTTGAVVTITTTDIAGNVNTRTQTIKVDKTAPSLTAKTDSITITQGDNVATSTYFNGPNYSISGGSMSCNPSNTSGLAVGNQTVTCTATGNNGLNISANKTITVNAKIFVDSSGASIPEVDNGLVPVLYNGTNWIVADTSQKWYDYNNKEWANAIIVKTDKKAEYIANKVVVEDDVLAYYVWIPKYEYKVNGKEQVIDVNFKKSTDEVATTDYIMHPAFTFGTTKLNGIWVGKFELTGDITTPTVKPNTTSLRSQTVSSFFATIQKIGNYGLTNSDSHMMKNTEWGAVAYLKQSKYGLGSIDIIINDDTSNLTGAGDYKANINQSTTGNITGIYDMSGGAFEYVMGNYNNTISYSGFSTMPNAKYYDTYTTSTGIKGDATNADGTNGWYGDSAGFVNASDPWFIRGGYYYFGANCGVFGFNYNSGFAGSNHSSRSVLTRP